MEDTMDAETVERPRMQAVAVRARNEIMAIVPQDLDQVWRMAVMVHKAKSSAFKTQEEICIAICHGLEIGMKPMQALQRIAVINGRPSIWGDAVPGIALGTGLVEDWTERVDGEGDQMVATCTVKRKGIRSPTTRTFSVADAKLARLWGKAGPWVQYPKRMLIMRARVAFRDLFADALGGFYIAEELIGVDEPKDITPLSSPESPPPGGKAELPPVAPSSRAADSGGGFISTKVIEGDLVNVEQTKGKPTKGKALPPLAKAAATPQQAPAVQASEPTPEAQPPINDEQTIVDIMLDHLDSADTQARLAAWASNNHAKMQKLPPNLKANVETAFNLKQATIQSQAKK